MFNKNNVIFCKNNIYSVSRVFLLLILTIVLSGCSALEEKSSIENPYGFWSGIFDGFFFIPRWVYSWFRPVDLFADFHTTSYTIGYVIGIVGTIGNGLLNAYQSTKK